MFACRNLCHAKPKRGFISGWNRQYCSTKTSTLRECLRWGDEYLSRTRNDNSIDYHDESLQLMAHTLNLNYQQAKQLVYVTGRDQMLSEEKQQHFQRLIVQRAEKHVPIQYLVGTASFYGREFNVNNNVLIPRSDSETLINAVLEHVTSSRNILRILDVGTGSGCLLITLLAELENRSVAAEGVGVDISSDALTVAKHNASTLLSPTTQISFQELDIFNGVPSGSFDIVISNPPYITTRDMMNLDIEVKDFEPAIALHGGQDGLAYYRQITSLCDKNEDLLKPDGLLFYEIGYDQGEQVPRIINNSQSLRVIESYQDLSSIIRVILARKIQK